MKYYFKSAICCSLSRRRLIDHGTQAGLSLIELMIAMTIGLVLVAGVTVLIQKQSSTRAELEKSNRQIESGRYAMQLLQEDIQLAGYYGEYSKILTAPASLPDPCTTQITPAAPALPLAAGIPLAIQGYDRPATVPTPLSACLPDENHVPNTSIIVIRRTDTATVDVGSATAGKIYLQSGLQPASPNFLYVLGTGPDASVFNLTKNDHSTIAPLRQYLVHIYFISPCNVPASGTSCTGTADGGNPTPTLKRLELSVSGGVASFVTVPLADGIENLQFDYGIDTTSDGAPDSFTTGTYSSGTTAMTATDWFNVMSVRVNLLARSVDKSAGYTSAKTYALGGAGTVGPFTDNYKRHVFSELVRAINPSSRRE